MRRIEATYSTIGQANPAHVEERKGYHYRGDQNWPQDRSAYESGNPCAKPDGGTGGTARKQARLDGFAAALAEQGYDAWTATGKAVIEAGRRVGVGYETARGYRNELKRQQIRDGEVTGA